MLVLSAALPFAAAERLRRLNVAAGRRVRVLRRAPFGGGLLLDAEGVRLAVRLSLAQCIEVAPAPPKPHAPEPRAFSLHEPYAPLSPEPYVSAPPRICAAAQKDAFPRIAPPCGLKMCGGAGVSACGAGAAAQAAQEAGRKRAFGKACVCGSGGQPRGRGRRGKKRAEFSGRVPRVLLAGNPNCGKSTLFNALTGGHAKTGNWHGVTVGVYGRAAVLGGRRAEVFDLPGIYSLQPYSLEEKIARREILSGAYDLTVCVAEALTLPRSLPFVQEVIARSRRAVLVVTMQDLLQRRGGCLNAAALSARLGVPVLFFSAHGRRARERLQAFLAAHLPEEEKSCSFVAETCERGGEKLQTEKSERGEGGEEPPQGGHLPPPRGEALLAGIYKPPRRGEGRAERLLYGRFALPLFFVLLAAVFALAFGRFSPAVFAKDGIERLFSEGIGGALGGLAQRGGSRAAEDFFTSLFSCLGMLFSFLPQLAVLYFALFFMEESGMMSALAFMTDGIFRRVGLTGRAVFSLLLGFGCTAAAILTTRGFENRRVQRRVILILPYISCSAKLPVWLALAGSFFGGSALFAAGMYALGVLLAFAAACLLKRFAGEGETFVMELAPVQRPSLLQACRSLLFSLVQFIIKVITAVAGFFVLAWLLLSFSFSLSYVGAASGRGMLAVLCRGLKYLFYPMGIRDWRIALAALSGLIAKENVAGMFTLFYGNAFAAAMSVPSAAAFAVFMLACSPCVSAIAAAAREAGLPRALLYSAIQTGTALLLGYVVYALFAAPVAALAAAAAAAAIVLCAKEVRGALVHRSAGDVSARFHGCDLSAGFVRPAAAAARTAGARKRRAHRKKRLARRRRRGCLLHHSRRRGASVLCRSVPRRKRARRR